MGDGVATGVAAGAAVGEEVAVTVVVGVVAVGFFSPPQSINSVIETWNGTTWSITPNSGSSLGLLTGVSCINSSVCLAVGNPEEIGPA